MVSRLSAAQVLFNAGATRARVEGTEAAHEQVVARYRQTVLASFEEAENLLVASRVLEQQEALRRQAATASARPRRKSSTVKRGSGRLYRSRHRAGDCVAGPARIVQLMAERQATAVALIQALGGGWHAPA